MQNPVRECQPLHLPVSCQKQKGCLLSVHGPAQWHGCRTSVDLSTAGDRQIMLQWCILHSWQQILWPYNWQQILQWRSYTTGNKYYSSAVIQLPTNATVVQLYNWQHTNTTVVWLYIWQQINTTVVWLYNWQQTNTTVVQQYNWQQTNTTAVQLTQLATNTTVVQLTQLATDKYYSSAAYTTGNRQILQ